MATRPDSLTLYTLEQVGATVEIKLRWDDFGHLTVILRGVIDETEETFFHVSIQPPLDCRPRQHDGSIRSEQDDPTEDESSDELASRESDVYDTVSAARIRDNNDPDASVEMFSYSTAKGHFEATLHRNLVGFHLVIVRKRTMLWPLKLVTIAGAIELSRFPEEEDALPMDLEGRFSMIN